MELGRAARWEVPGHASGPVRVEFWRCRSSSIGTRGIARSSESVSVRDKKRGRGGELLSWSRDQSLTKGASLLSFF
jgi:hypothetical protein